MSQPLTLPSATLAVLNAASVPDLDSAILKDLENATMTFTREAFATNVKTALVHDCCLENECPFTCTDPRGALHLSFKMGPCHEIYVTSETERRERERELVYTFPATL